uniref:Uncharacterized protein n=1 Tax=Euplotes harpa TaxID=151035 RepID=A0A7S3N8U3_9SPIT|mmetsp:Transcript_24609/g.28294  ORF Transcript_24609/g.28294 Transcript_24609/m.28294 type:complete len:194 (+) Transcript_24609:2-583(+)
MGKLKENLKDNFDRVYRNLKLKFAQSRVSINIHSILKYQKIYTELMTHQVPILKNNSRKKRIKMLGFYRNAIMVSGIMFMIMYSRIGLLNRLLISLVVTNLLNFATKGYFYSEIIEECADEMSLVGQEARIQLRYHFPEHPNYELYGKTIQLYFQLSEEHKEEIEAYKQAIRERLKAEQDEDAKFEQKLKKSQ